MLDHEEFYELIEIDPDFKELKTLEAYDDFWEFCLYMDYDFFTKRESILKGVAKAFQDVEDGKINLLYVAMPPRAGKSYITTLFSAWLLGRHPEEAIMRNTVTEALYSKFSEDLRDIMQGQSHNNRYKDIFSHVAFATEKVSGWKLKQAETGVSYFGSGVGGSIIGFGATLAAILDDSVKNAEEAMSQTIMDKKWSWYTSTHKSRVEKNVPEIHIATRWSLNDIPGRLIKQKKFEKNTATKIEIPALVNGKSFCEDVKTTEEYKEIKSSIPSIIWDAEYMQNPVEAKGLLFPEESLNRFKLKDLNENPDAIVMVGDIADEGDDSLSCPVAYIFGHKAYIVDVIFNSEDPIEVTQPMTAALIDEYKPDLVQFESNNGGKGFALTVADLVQNNRTQVTWERTTSNKHTRILMKSGFVKNNFYFLDSDDIEPGSEYDRFISQLLQYNKVGKVAHDDAPDSVTMLAELINPDQYQEGEDTIIYDDRVNISPF